LEVARAEAMEDERVAEKEVVRAEGARAAEKEVVKEEGARAEGARVAEAMEGGATEAEAMEVGATEEEAMEGGATEAEAMEGGATEAADWEEATGVEAMEAEAARSNKTCRPAPPRHGPQLHRRRSTLPKDTRGGSSRYDHLPHRPQHSATRHYVRPLHLRSHPWPESDQRQQLVKNERPPSHRRHRRLRCTRSQRN